MLPYPKASLAALLIVAFVASSGLRLSAQDVIVTPLAWRNPAGAPDELPRPKHPLKLDVPPELKASPDINYVVYDLYLDPDGKTLGIEPHPTLPNLSSALHDNYPRNNSSHWKPGRRAGQGVNTETTFGFIYNPASAREGFPDATPRLLEVTVVRRRMPRETKRENIPPQRVVIAEVALDDHGQVLSVKDAPADLAREFEQTAKGWRFAPARHAGKPVPAVVRVPFVVAPYRWVYEATTHSRVPRVLFQQPPEYPEAMRASGMKAKVVVDFLVDIEGRVRNAYSAQSSNPSFDDAALDAVRRWRFEPGQEEGRPVTMHLQVPIFFVLETYGGGRDAVVTASKADLAKLPEEFRYDTPPKPSGIARPVYPYQMLCDRKGGHAVVRYVVGPNGTVDDAKVDEATTPEFGAALLAAVESFTYQPAFKGGRPSSALLGFQADFHPDSETGMVSEEDFDLVRRERKNPTSITTMRGLDAPLQPLSRHPARFPVSLAPEVTSGKAMIEFLVDEEGRVRLPRIVEATNRAFGYAAIQSVVLWRFEPPLQGGQPTAVRVRMPVEFSRRAPGGAATRQESGKQ